ncbi:unnamed protein product [Lactuca saligna]|uniref:Uncharacterized protein n=1 Tax=Lactuca saligna TaxID=75948 RepID=A0AA36A5B1_LACSI|nr:unnamed protein product [Lactuca saligna]
MKVTNRHLSCCSQKGESSRLTSESPLLLVPAKVRSLMLNQTFATSGNNLFATSWVITLASKKRIPILRFLNPCPSCHLPIRQDDPDMIFGDDKDEALGGFTYSPFQIRIENEDEPSATKAQR